MKESKKGILLLIATLFLLCIVCACGSSEYDTGSLNDISVLPDGKEEVNRASEGIRYQETEDYNENYNKDNTEQLQHEEQSTEQSEYEEQSNEAALSPELANNKGSPAHDDTTEVDPQLIEEVHSLLDGTINYDQEVVITPGSK